MKVVSSTPFGLLVFGFFMFVSVGSSKGETLKLLDSFEVRDKHKGYSEPSGLSPSSVEGLFWTVSDADAKLHLLTSDGDLKNAFHLPENLGGDLEAVASRPDGSVLLVQERDWAITVLKPTSPISLERILVRRMSGFGRYAHLFRANPSNKGPEGIAVDSETGTVFLAIEGEPRVLLTLAPELNEIVNATVLSQDKGFASVKAKDGELDISGLAWSQFSNTLWMLSDTGKCVFVFDPKTNTAERIDLKFHKAGEKIWVKNAEGVVVDEEARRMFILTDDGKDSRLLVFERL
ncbi:SdiA-regulated domain-containing protein [Shimia sp. R10_1]|uniref:SdiA-regulated domain-containing protein n=1 Tax=Shimia sp. R10_1 TaxID=2821095 RepID=UPI001ADB0458|nr:SdiA-regulated domain-containing protein [Shimia sp. R10_1]MBO9475869.1 SdiA-regulated domain-containing protein [Shimia sp. R10_1]